MIHAFKIFKRKLKCQCCSRAMSDDEIKYHFIFTKFYKCKASIKGKLKDTYGASMEVTACEDCTKSTPAHEMAEKAYHFNRLVNKENIQKVLTEEGEEEIDESLW